MLTRERQLEITQEIDVVGRILSPDWKVRARVVTEDSILITFGYIHEVGAPDFKFSLGKGDCILLYLRDRSAQSMPSDLCHTPGVSASTLTGALSKMLNQRYKSTTVGTALGLRMPSPENTPDSFKFSHRIDPVDYRTFLKEEEGFLQRLLELSEGDRDREIAARAAEVKRLHDLFLSL